MFYKMINARVMQDALMLDIVTKTSFEDVFIWSRKKALLIEVNVIP